MLRKRNRSIQKDQHHMGHNWDYYSQSHGLGTKLRNKLIFNVPRLFVGLVPNSLLDSDSVLRSPTSPLDVVKVLPAPKSCHRSWDCSKVGLGILDSFHDSSDEFSGKIMSSSTSSESNSKIPISSPRMKINNSDSFEASKSLPKDFCKLPYAQTRSSAISNSLFEIGETCLDHEPFRKSLSCSMDSGFFSVKDMSTQAIFPHSIETNQNYSELNSQHLSSLEFVESLSAGEIEESEDYTCIISHGPNPKTTRFFRDCILETHSDDLRIHGKNEEKKENGVFFPVPSPANCSRTPNRYPSNSFLSFCYHCNKKLDEGKDIYIYRGEEAFCSSTCRDLEIMIDEGFRKSSLHSENSQEREIGEELFETT